MALNSLGLGFVFTARDLASAKMTSLERRFSSLDDRVSGGTERITGAFRELGIGLAVFTAGAATVAGAFALADAAGRFEQAIAAVAVVSGATATELEALRNAAIDAGIETQFSPTEATVGLRELAQAGFNAQESIGLLRPVLDLAAGSLGELSPQAAAGLASQAMKAFGISVEGAGVAVDQMLQAVNVFALNASELPLALGTASRGAQALSQAALDELVDDLSSAVTGTPGASKVGADAVAGTPNALPAGNVDGQPSQLLAWFNAHVGAITGAHNASAIAATAHNNISGVNVQSQLQEIVTDLGATGAGSAGSTLVGVDAIAGAPNALAAGTVRAGIAALLGFINAHLNQASSAHAASAISVADAGANLNAVNVETSLAEIVDAYEGDHFRGNESNAGQHRSIRQPALGGSKALILDSNASGTPPTHLRIYADTDSVWFTLNVSWNGSAWARDNTGYFAGAIRFSRTDIEFLHENSLAATFTTWTRGWRLPMSSGTNSAFELSGTVQEVGHVGTEWSNADNATRTLASGGSVTFRNRFPATPSSITFSVLNASSGFSGTPSTYFPTRDGFGFFSYQSISGFGTAWWFGTYTAVA